MRPLNHTATPFNQLRVFIPKSKRLPPNPHLSDIWQDAMVRALAPPPSGKTSSESRESRINTKLWYKLLAYDQRSFFTGSSVADLEVAHIFAPLRKDKAKKIEVEKFLTQQRFHHPESHRFVLDSIENAMLLESNFNIQWRDYATFCFVPAESDAKAMLTSLHEINALWQMMTDRNPGKTCIRPLDVSQAPFNQPHWDVLLLRPDALLPENQVLLISLSRAFQKPGYSERFHGTRFTNWGASGDSLVSHTEGSEPKRLPPFVARDIRAEFKQPPFSSLAMVVNAQNKVQQFVDEHRSSRGNCSAITPRIKRYADLLSDLVEAIFFVPNGNAAVYSRAAGKALRDEDHVADNTRYSNGTDAFSDLLVKKINDSNLSRKERAEAAQMLLSHLDGSPSYGKR
ncbi:hypothetical protein BDN70DRAFT_990208 [Pholiota conissans]|uniref:Uncharacterized protein n=1 Tax=Pholiota conissans TaxID=109636 RepID=A0A9P5ZCZ3_9AGAR|nr:hypothetical protein BDN70DRAFT_990208 [Pholiota conissans]